MIFLNVNLSIAQTIVLVTHLTEAALGVPYLEEV
jgi:hypothetical protein